MLKQEIEAVLQTRGRDEWMELLDEAGIPCGPINNIRDVVGDPQVRHRNMIVAAEDATAGTVRMSGNPIKMSRFEDRTGRAPSPDLDQHRQDLLAELGLA